MIHKNACYNCPCFILASLSEWFGQCRELRIGFEIAVKDDFNSYYGCFGNYNIRDIMKE